MPRGQALVPADELAALRRDAALWREKGAAKPAAKPAAAKKEGVAKKAKAIPRNMFARRVWKKLKDHDEVGVVVRKAFAGEFFYGTVTRVREKRGQAASELFWVAYDDGAQQREVVEVRAIRYTMRRQTHTYNRRL